MGLKMKHLLVDLYLVISFSLFLSCKEEPTPTSPVENDPLINLTYSEKELVNELNKFIKPLKGTSITNDNSDLQVFDHFATAKIIGLGEATHGTKEFFQMKHRLFKYFVERHGFKIFGFEADMGECIYIDRFITNDIGTLDDAMQKMHFWTWRTQEVKELILWMNQYNKGKSQGDKIHLLGVDCQFVTYNKALIEEYLSKYLGSYPHYISNILTVIGKLTYSLGPSITSTQKAMYKLQCDSVYAYLEENKNKLISLSGNFEYNIISRLVKQSLQFIDVITVKNYNYRDLYMAENTIWLTELLSTNTKVVSWAHNGHLAKDPSYSGTGSQGHFLARDLFTQYKAIGFSFNNGSFRAVGYNTQQSTFTGLTTHSISQLPPNDSFNYIFNFSQPQNFILIKGDIFQNSPLYKWINSSKKFLSIGSVYTSNYFNYFYTTNLGSIYDAVVHFHTTTASVQY